MLRDLFTHFDKRCEYYHCYKVYTIGDCYVVNLITFFQIIKNNNNKNFELFYIN